ncbi:Transcription factor 25 [Rhizophlyctis rosea]|uniref:Transcription factor 25 n=1 Tax=Rhizophlyctis rosea TaxID=64517 RepID=A0AAD5S8M1_9FUNG|nr:Transcription factor 25 [Rhizophlyctis rosea]
MSSRAYRKLLKEKGGLEPAPPAIDKSESSADESDSDAPTPKQNLFDLLNAGEDNVPLSDSSDDADAEPSAAVHIPTPPSSKNAKKKKKKKQSKGKQPAADTFEEQPSEDEIDRTLRELTEKFGDTSTSAAPTKKTADDTKTLLSVDARMMDADAEMKRMFGSRVVNEEIKKKNYVRTPKKHLLAAPRAQWPRMERLSEVCKHNGDAGMAAELIERALLALERAFNSMFNVATGTCRLPYIRFENRAMHLALFRQIDYLTRRGCWRTAFEFAKLLLSLDPDEDPLGSLLSIDYYAIRAKELRWFQRLHSEWGDKKGFKYFPNVAYSAALVQWQVEDAEGQDHTESSRLLQTAIAYFPSAVPALYNKCATTDSAVVGNSFFTLGRSDSETSLKLLIDLFVERNHTLWKVPEVLAWLKENVAVVVERLKGPDAKIREGREVLATRYLGGVKRNWSRHIFISEFQSISAALPPDVLAHGVQMHDPIPPENTPPTVYDEYQRSLAGRANPFQDMGFLAGFLRSLLPWMNVNNAAGAAPPPVRDGGEGPVERDLGGGVEGPAGEANEDHIAATIRAAQQALPGIFPPATEDNPNPEWMATLRDTIGRLGLFGGGGAGGAGAGGAELEGEEDEDGDEDGRPGRA